MARVQIAVEVVKEAGVLKTETAVAADGHMFLNDGNVVLRITNGATALTLTAITHTTVKGLAVDDKAFTIGANENWEMRFDPNVFNDPNQMVFIDYSDTTDGTVEVGRQG